MPPEAKIFHVDDNKDIQDSLNLYLEMCGHQIVDTAYTRKEAFKKFLNLVI